MDKIAENIFTYDYTTKIMPGVRFPVRSTFIALDNNALMVISPGPFEPEMIQNIITKYHTVHCVAPNAFHHRYLEHFRDLFPNIDFYGPSSLSKKQPWLSGHLLGFDALREILRDQVLVIPILGNATLDETVFYCQQSKSLVVTDLCFNMRNPMPLGRRCLLSLVGARNKMAQSKLVKATIKDAAAFTRSINILSELDCRRIIAGHGEIIEGAAEISKAFRLMGASV